MRLRFIAIPLIALPVLLVLFLSGCNQKPPPVHKQQILALGTLIAISLYDQNDKTAAAAVRAVLNELETIHHDWHAWDEHSPLVDINKRLAAGETVKLTPTGAALIQTGIDLSKRSGGLFNPAAGKLFALWGFHSSERPDTPPPTQAEIQALLNTAPSMNDLSLKEGILKSTNPAVQFDFGGYAKGYAVDRAVEALRTLGIHNAIVNAGGDLRAIGDKGGQPWLIGIRNPRGAGFIASLEVRGDESVFTSGDYERYFHHDGRRYHHILDPRNGYPAQGLSSVTIIHPDAATADAGATALFIAGAEWPQTAAAMGLEQVMVITEKGQLQMTPAMHARTRIELEPAPDVRITALP